MTIFFIHRVAKSVWTSGITVLSIVVNNFKTEHPLSEYKCAQLSNILHSNGISCLIFTAEVLIEGQENC